MSDPKLLRRKGKERHIFLFEQSLLFSKETKDTDGKIKYMFKFKLKVFIGSKPSILSVYSQLLTHKCDTTESAKYTRRETVQIESIAFFSCVI